MRAPSRIHGSKKEPYHDGKGASVSPSRHARDGRVEEDDASLAQGTLCFARPLWVRSAAVDHYLT